MHAVGERASEGAMRHIAKTALRQGWRIETGRQAMETWYAPNGTRVLSTGARTVPAKSVLRRLRAAGLKLD